MQIAQDVYAFSQEHKNEVEIPSTPDESESNANVLQSDSSSSDKDNESSDEDQPNAKPQSGGASSGGNTAKIESEIEEDIIDDWDDEDEEEDGAGSEGGDESSTQRSFDDASEKLSSPDSKDLTYVEIPEKVNLDKHVVDWKKLHDWIDSQAVESVAYAEVDHLYNEFRKQSQKEVNYLVKEFECRKSADAYARSGQSKTGVLDTTKLHTYLYNEDIFKKITVLPDGKNHGLLFLLDWSGSMQHEILATVKQLLNLTSFCKKVQIPFEVYGFTNDWIVTEIYKS